MSNTMQNINLYLPEFRKKKHWLDAEKMLLVAGAGIVLLLLGSGVEYFQLSRVRAELALKQQEQQQAAAATEALRAEFGVQTEDEALLAQIRELEDDLQSKQALLQFLEGRELGNAEGFSEYLADLSRYHIDGLSLNYVRLAEGGRTVEFAGEVLRPELPSLFLKNLANGRAYAGKEFESLQITDASMRIGFLTDATNRMATWKVRSLRQ